MARSRWSRVVFSASRSAVLTVVLSAVVGCGNAQAEADTRAFLAGPGASLLVMHRTALDQSRAGATPDDCRARAGALQRVLNGNQALSLVAQVPDQELQGALGAERVALAQSLSACVRATGAPSTDLPGAATSVEKRLDKLEVPR